LMHWLSSMREKGKTSEPAPNATVFSRIMLI